MNNEEYIWGENVSRIVIWTPEKKKIIYGFTELKERESVFYVQSNKETTHRIGVLEGVYIGPKAPNGKAIIHFLNCKGSGFGIDAHVERIPFWFDKPKEYELVTDNIFNSFEMIGDYAILKAGVKKQRAIKDLVSKLE